MELLIERTLLLFGALLLLLAAYCACVWIPVALVVESGCLSRGFPKSAVTIGLNRYCMNMDGAVTTVVVPLK